MEVLAIEGAVDLNVTLLGNIVRAVKNVRQFRQQCLELGNMVRLLLAVMEADHAIENNNSSTAGSSPLAKSSVFSGANTSVRLKATLDETHAFILKCTGEWNVWQQGWEAIVTQKVPRLKQEIFEWINLCMLETSVSTNMQIEKLINITKDWQELLTRADATSEQINNIRRLGQLQQAEQREQPDEEPINIRFPEGDSRLQQIIQLGESQNLLGAVLKDVGQVVCKEIKNDWIRHGRGWRHVEIYQLISTGSLFEAFYGIAELGGKRYAVMEDLQNDRMLAVMIDSDELNGRLTRLQLAYEVASAVAYLHSVDIVVKNISDVNIVLKRFTLEDGPRFRPCLTNLEYARTIVESTTWDEHDVRFESPEFSTSKRHSRNSDVWSLGVVIWELIVGTFPFSTAPTNITSDEDESVIRQNLASGRLPWTVKDNIQGWDDVYTIVHSCWNSRPTMRPPAPYVAQTLLDFYTRRSLGSTTSIYEVPGEVQGSIFEKIRSKRKNPHATVTSISDDDALKLKRSVDEYGDPHNSFLLGAAIWWELVPQQAVEAFADLFSEGRLGYNNLKHPPEVKRARVALSYLENSVDDAIEETSLAYGVLAHHFYVVNSRK